MVRGARVVVGDAVEVLDRLAGVGNTWIQVVGYVPGRESSCLLDLRTPEIAVFRPSDGHFYISKDNCAWDAGCRLSVAWGQAGDVPVPADYNGDGTDDIAVFRPSDGTWHIR